MRSETTIMYGCRSHLRYLFLIGCIVWHSVSSAQYGLLNNLPAANATVRTMVLDQNSSTLYVGGEFTIIGGVARDRLAAIDVLTGEVLPWNPGANGTVHAMERTGSMIYVGGDFTLLGGGTHERLGAIDAESGAVSSWSPSLNGTVYTILPGVLTIYVGGTFTTANGITRNRVAAFEEATGLLLPWDPNVNSIVRCLARRGSNILIGGAFTAMGPLFLTMRGRIAEVDPLVGLATLWNPACDAVVTAIAEQGSTVYIGGSFTHVDGQPRTGLAAINGLTGNVTSWAPSVATVQHLSVHGNSVMVGGFFSTVNGVPHSNVAVLDKNTGAIEAAFPTASSTVYSIIRSTSGLILAGAFTLVNETQPRDRLAGYSACTLSTWFADADGDGFGDASSTASACAQPSGFVPGGTDCDDTDNTIGGPLTWYADLDGDGVGDPLAPVMACEQPPNTSSFNTDCDDTDELIFAGATCDDGNARSYQDRIDLDCECKGRPARVGITVFLEGAFNGTDMRTDLLDAGLIPLEEPYTAMGYTFVNGGGGETALPGDLDAEMDAFDAVDWVVVELRAHGYPHEVMESHAFLLRRNGAVTTPAGDEAEFPNSDAGIYQIAVRHRNHLAAMTLGEVLLGEADGTAALQSPFTSTFGVNATKNISGTMVLWMGNTDFSGDLLYVGSGNDRDPILVRIGGTVPTNTAAGYFLEDANLDGIVRYVGSENDRDPILQNIGGSIPTNARFEQLPPP